MSLRSPSRLSPRVAISKVIWWHMSEPEKKRVQGTLELDVGEYLDLGEKMFGILRRAVKQAAKKGPSQAKKDLKKLTKTVMAAAEAYLEADDEG